MYCYLWEYEVESDQRGRFEEVYGTDGPWVGLFRRDPEYVRTILLRDRTDPGRFLTLDFWTSREASEAFRERNREAFDKLDTECDALTRRETHLGDFDIL